jgi:tol-pal system protein YbgF
MGNGGAVRWVLVLPLVLLGGACASKGDVQQMESNMLAEIRAIKASQDSLNRELRGAVVDSLETQEMRLGQIETELQRSRAYGQVTPVPVVPGGPIGDAGTGTPGGAAAGDDAAAALYNSAQNQFNRGAYATARAGFAEYLRIYSDSELAPDAQFYLARTHEETDDPAAALAEYARVLELYPNSRRAPSALYASGRIELDRGNTQDAIEFFSRVVRGYPNSDEAILAERRLSDLRQ